MTGVARPSWPVYFMDITKLVSRRSTCLRRSVGAILVKDKRILATGYNGAPAGLKHCEEVGCLRADSAVPSGTRHELCRGFTTERDYPGGLSRHLDSGQPSIVPTSRA
jgi:dCMP deaminase